MTSNHGYYERFTPLLACTASMASKVGVWGICIGMLILSGCKTPPPPESNVMLEDSLPAVTPEEWSADAQAGAVDTGWVKTFNDKQLEVFIDEVVQNNLDLRTAAFQVQSAAAAARRAGADLMPKVAIGGSSRYLDSFDSSDLKSDNSGVTAIVSWELDVWGRVRAGRAAAQSNYEATEADYQFARLSLVALATKTWYLATETSQQLDFAEEVVEVQAGTLVLVTAKFDEGQLSRKEVYLSSADLHSAKDRLQEVTMAHKEAIRALELLLGRYPAAELKVMKEYVPLPPPVPAGIPMEILERRPDLIAAEKRAAAAFHLITEAKMARLPRISLTGAAGYSNSEVLQVLDANQNYWTVAANFLAPIYTGGALKEQVNIRTTEQEAALVQYGRAALKAFNEVETALTNEPLLAEREKYLQAALNDNEGALDIAQTQFDNGKLDLLSVLQMQKRVIASKINHISSQNERLAQRVNLHLALGGSFKSTELSDEEK